MLLTTRFFAIAMLTAAAAVPTMARADAQSDVSNAYQKMMDSRFSAEMTTTGDGKTTKASGEYDTIKRIHMKMPEMEIIVLPEGTWMRTGDGDWTKPPIDMSAMFKRFMPQTIADMQKGISNVKDEGKSTWQGQPVQVVSYDMNTKVMGFSISSHNRLWIDDSGRAIHSEVDSTAMGHKSHTVQDIKYDDSIRVTAPQ